MRYFRTLTISIGIHLLILLILAQFASRYRLSSIRSNNQITVIDLLEKPEDRKRPYQPPSDEKQFVRKADIPAELLTKEKREKRFSSDDERIVLEEQQARNSGMTANRAGSDPNSKEIQSKSSNTKFAEKSQPRSKKSLNFKPDSVLEKGKKDLQTQGAPENLESGADGIPVAGLSNKKREPPDGSRPLALPTFNGIEAGQSTVGESLPNDIKFGEFTALNTDRHLYYTFYARMEEQIRHRWVGYARAVLFNYRGMLKTPPGVDTYSTRLEVILDRKGNFLRAILHKGSGVQGLDSAPVQAFRDAKQFPNPPEEMVKDDGTIHLHYAFNVNVVPQFAKGAEDE